LFSFPSLEGGSGGESGVIRALVSEARSLTVLPVFEFRK
jgi:hypothetical protein